MNRDKPRTTPAHPTAPPGRGASPAGQHPDAGQHPGPAPRPGRGASPAGQHPDAGLGFGRNDGHGPGTGGRVGQGFGRRADRDVGPRSSRGGGLDAGTGRGAGAGRQGGVRAGLGGGEGPGDGLDRRRGVGRELVVDGGDDEGDEYEESEGGEEAPRRRRRRVAVVGVLVLVAVVAAVVAAVRRDGGGHDGGQGTAATTTAAVEVRDLVQSDEYEGELGFGETDAVTAGRSGVVTGVAPAGTTIGQGDVLFGLDLQPTVLLRGTIPAFRDLSVDADPGADITQLEQALVDLGHGDGVTVDDEFTDATADAVEEWEEALGRSDPDGVVTLGDVVFAPADLRIAEVSADIGTQVQAGAEVMTVTATTKVVTLQLTVDQVADVEAGTPVQVTLPDRTEATGKIADIAEEPTTDGSTGDPVGGEGGDGDEETFPVTVALDDPTVADAFESGTVDVTVERSRTEDATAVPVLALLALSEGGYALQVVDDTEASGYRLVAVEVGTIAGEWAQVTGDGIEAGVEVVVPE